MRTLLLVCAYLLLSGVTFVALPALANPQGQDPIIPTLPGNVPPAPAELEKPQASTTAKPDYSKEAFVIEQLRRRYRFENDGTGHKVGSLRIHVLSEAGVQAFGQLRFGYNSANDRMEIGYVRVTKPDGSIVTAGPDAVQDLTGPVQQVAPVYTDYREKHITVPGLRPGDTLECEVTTVFHTAVAPGQFWMQDDFNRQSIVLDEQLEIDIPASRTVKLKTKPGSDAKITEENGRRIYRWTTSRLVNDDDNNPADNGNSSNKNNKKKKKKKTEEIPDVQMSTFSSWEEVGRWYAALEKDRRNPSKEVSAKAADLTKGLTTDTEKTEALYDFVAKNFRYVSLSLGLARYQPQPAADILHNQYGDCKDKNTLLAALLESQGLHSASVLISSNRKLDPDVPSPSQFSHVITMLPLGKDELWMDTTTEVAPFRLLSYNLRKKQALVIPQNGVPHLEETPENPPVPDKLVAEVQGAVDESGRLEATVTYTFRGDSELQERMLFRHAAAAQWQKYGESLNQGLGGDVSEVKVGDPAATRVPFVVSYKVSRGNFIDWSKKKLQLKLPLSYISPAAVADDVDEPVAAADSTVPENFQLGPASEYIYQLKLDLAKRYQAAPPVPVALERDYGAFESTYKIDGSTFIAERKLTTKVSELPPARADDYRAFRRSILADGAQSLSIENASADPHAAPVGMKTADLVRSGNEARKNGNYALAIGLLNRAVEADPKNKTAWNDLGLAYYDEREDGLAINAYKKQIEINPYDQNAYNNLGRVYLRQRKYDESDKWFKKQIEVDPLDKYAHANLGSSYIEQHKYQDAVPELEKAASITPDSADAQIRLGNAYLNLGQDDKALPAFDKAVKASATPAVWNSIAYNLSLKHAHLDIARRYAESAVTGTATRLRNVSLDRLQRQDLPLVSSLSAYWDTLGWVAFMEGNLDEAEKYIFPAWQLGRYGDEGDHLGQIYEQRGKKTDAAHFYALALNSRRPEPETRSRLASLLGGDDQVDAMLEKYRDETRLENTINLPNPAKLDGKADFFVLLNQATSSSTAVEAVSLVSGDEKMKALFDPLRSATYNQKFPDQTAVKIIRRGTASCQPDAGCTFVLILPDETRSVD